MPGDRGGRLARTGVLLWGIRRTSRGFRRKRQGRERLRRRGGLPLHRGDPRHLPPPLDEQDAEGSGEAFRAKTLAFPWHAIGRKSRVRRPNPQVFHSLTMVFPLMFTGNEGPRQVPQAQGLKDAHEGREEVGGGERRNPAETLGNPCRLRGGRELWSGLWVWRWRESRRQRWRWRKENTPHLCKFSLRKTCENPSTF